MSTPLVDLLKPLPAANRRAVVAWIRDYVQAHLDLIEATRSAASVTDVAAEESWVSTFEGELRVIGEETARTP